MDSKAKWLYFATLLLEMPGAFLRYLVLLIFGPFILFPFWLVFFFFGWLYVMGQPDTGLFMSPRTEAWVAVMRLGFWINSLFALILAFANIGLSLLTVTGAYVKMMVGNTYTRLSLGARDPSRREREKVLPALEQIEEQAPGSIRAPDYWYVLDSPELNGYAIGSTLYVTRELINSSHLAAVVAHELGHFNSADSRLILANQRFILPFAFLLKQIDQKIIVPGMWIVTGLTQEQYSPRTDYLISLLVLMLSFIFSLMAGGFGLLVLNPLWVWYWRQREYDADHFAAECGMAQPLVDYLEQHQYFDVAQPFFLSAHPYTELRIDRLLAYQENQ
jgi:Zn-dependent protease with chaperone function